MKKYKYHKPDADEREFRNLNFRFIREKVLTSQTKGLSEDEVTKMRDKFVQENLSAGNRYIKELRLDV